MLSLSKKDLSEFQGRTDHSIKMQKKSAKFKKQEFSVREEG